LPAESPLVLEASAADGWILLRSGTLLIASCVVPVADMKQQLAFAIALRPEPDTSQPQSVAAITAKDVRADASKSPHLE
jgi:hypothetical protein